MAGARPGGVTLLAVIVWLEALLYLVIGVLSVLALWIPALIIDIGWGFGVLWNGIIAILFGIVLFVVSGGLFRGSGVARALVTIWLVVSIVGAVFSLVHGQVLAGVVALALSIIGILLLWAGRAGSYFRS